MTRTAYTLYSFEFFLSSLLISLYLDHSVSLPVFLLWLGAGRMLMQTSEATVMVTQGVATALPHPQRQTEMERVCETSAPPDGSCPSETFMKRYDPLSLSLSFPVSLCPTLNLSLPSSLSLHLVFSSYSLSLTLSPSLLMYPNRTLWPLWP